MILTRFCSSEKMGVFGTLEYKGKKFYTVEKPNRDNKPFDSCIPDGFYTLVPHTSKRFGETFKLVNESKNVFENPPKHNGRYSILIHSGNTEKDVVGCVAVGSSLGFIAGRWAVLNSKNAMSDLRALWAEEEPKLIKIKSLTSGI